LEIRSHSVTGYHH
jgi:hypothetical protein